MAFESSRRQEERWPRRPRQIALVLVTVLYGALIAAGIVHSYWQVEELTPPTLRVTFMSMAPPPPPPPPPPAGGRAGGPKVAISTELPKPVERKPPKTIQPPEKIKPVEEESLQREDEYDGVDNADPSARVSKGSSEDQDGGVEGGTIGGTTGGKIGGKTGGKIDGKIDGKIGGVAAAQSPQSMPTQFGALRKKSGGLPPFPESLIRGQRVYAVGTKICVSATGDVDTVTLTKRSDTLLDASVLDTVRTWRYRPMTINNTAVAFCYPVTFEFRSEE